MTDKKTLSSVEITKLDSNYLRGAIAEELANPSDSFEKDTVQLLKHHGIYQQDDRDLREAARREGRGGKVYSLMVRTKVPGGRLASEQLLAELDLCDELGNSTLRITSRQSLQLHSIVKRNIKQAIRRIHQVQLTTLAGCGDMVRNVMCCPAPRHGDRVFGEMQRLADRLSSHFAPRTRAYHEIWLEDPDAGWCEQLVGEEEGADEEIEPIYGRQYLPRKFKMAICLPGDNCVDIYTNDLGFLAVCRGGRIVGYNVLVGGGLGVTPSLSRTFPALAQRMTFVAPEQVLDLAAAVVKVQRDFGNRADRRTARLKYLLADWGPARFKTEVERYFGQALPEPEPDDVCGFDDHLGWHEQGDGLWYYGLCVENGRILDNRRTELKWALREICRTYSPRVRLTAGQSILLADIAPENRSAVEQILRKHRVRLSEEFSSVRRLSMACVALPTCGLAITEAERALPDVMDRLEIALARLGLASERFAVRMTGCSNACSRPYVADIGLVGKARGRYTIYLSGRCLGDRLSFVYKDRVPKEEIVAELVPIFTYFKQARLDGESFGDFCHRKGKENLSAWVEEFAAGAPAE